MAPTCHAMILEGTAEKGVLPITAIIHCSDVQALVLESENWYCYFVAATRLALMKAFKNTENFSLNVLSL